MRIGKAMKLYLITQTERRGYDTFDSAVVAATSAKKARETHPEGRDTVWDRPYSSWACSPDAVTAKCIGQAAKGVEAGVICASFNAG